MRRVSYVCFLHLILPYHILVKFQDRSTVTHFKKRIYFTSEPWNYVFFFITDQAQPNKKQIPTKPRVSLFFSLGVCFKSVVVD